MSIDPGQVFWWGNRTFIVGSVGSKYVTGLLIESDGLHVGKVSLADRLEPAMYHGKPYPAPKMRGHLRRMQPASQGAKAIRKQLLGAAR